MDDVAVVIGQDLKLNVPWLLDQPFHVERPVAEGRGGFPPRLRDRLDEVAVAARCLHPDAPATFRWFEQDGEAHAARGVGNRII